MVSSLIHVLAECRECNFQTKNSFPYIEKIRSELIRHSKITGHEVFIETGRNISYKNGERI